MAITAGISWIMCAKKVASERVTVKMNIDASNIRALLYNKSYYVEN